MKINISQDNIESFTKAIITQFQEYLKENELIDPTKINEYFRAFLQTEQVQKLFQDEMVKIIQTSGLTEQFENQLQIVMAQYTDTISKSLQQQINVQITKQMDNLAIFRINIYCTWFIKIHIS